MENFNHKNYRDNLAKDLQDIRKDDPEKAQEILDEEQQTTRYSEAEESHSTERKKSQEISSDYSNNPNIENSIQELEEKKSDILKNQQEKLQTLTSEQIIQFTGDMNYFWKDKLKDWSLDGQDLANISFTPEFKNPRDINFDELAKAPHDPNEFGHYLTNPETAFLNYESMGEPEIFDPRTDQAFKNWFKTKNREKDTASVMEYVRETYGDTHYLPGIEYLKYLFAHKNRIPQFFKEGGLYFLPGTTFRIGNGCWLVPSGNWGRLPTWGANPMLLMGGSPVDGVDGGWNSNERVILFGKDQETNPVDK